MDAVGDDSRFATLSPGGWETLRSRVAAFEAAWAGGGRPDLREFLPAEEDPSGGQLLVELAHVDLEFRIAAGEAARVERYLAAYPALLETPGAVAGLMETERFARRLREPALDDGEYRDRFPSHYDEFLRLVRLAEEEDESPAAVRNGDATEDLPSVPGYEVIGPAGRGGMGVVYKAVDRRLDRTVAIKTVRSGADTEERERLRREAVAAAALEHPNVARIYQVLEESGRLYVVGEYLSGGTLAERSRGKPLGGREAAELVEPLARAVAYAHSRGVVHRDLKPQNVLLTADGTPKVADFGLSKRLGDDSQLTRSGVLAGSPSYMAPEQVAAVHDAGPAADIWALGAVLYELLTGRPPFRGVTVFDTLDLVRHAEPVPPSRLVPRLPRDLETVCLKCLGKEPARRYASADLLADDLARFRRGEPVLAKPVGRIGRAARWAKRNRTTAALLALLAVSLAAGSGGSLWYATTAKSQARRAETNERAARRLLFASDMSLAAEAVRAGDISRAAELLDAHAAERSGPYAFVWNHLDRLIRAPGAVIDRLPRPARYARFSPDGKMLAACGEGGLIRLYAAPTWMPKGAIDAGQGELYGLAFSPDGLRLASAGEDGTVVLWDLGRRQPLWRSKVYESDAYKVAFGSGGSVLVACGNEPPIRLLDPATGQVLASFDGDNRDVEDVTVTPDGRTLLSAGYDGRAAAWDLATRAELWRQMAGDLGRFRSVACSPDGRFAAFGTVRSAVLVVEVATGRVVHRGPPPSGRATGQGPDFRCVAFLPGGDLAIAGDDGVVRLFGLTEQGLNATAGPRGGWQAHGGRIESIAAGPDGELVTAARDGVVAAWRPNAGAAWRSFRSDDARVAGVTWLGPDAEPVALSHDHGVRILDPESGVMRAIMPADDEWTAGTYAGGRFFCGSEHGRLRAWRDGPDGLTPLWERHLGDDWRVFASAAPADGSWVAAEVKRRSGSARPPGPDQFVAVFDAADGRTIAERAMPEFLSRLAASPDGRWVAASQNRTVLLLDPRTLATRAELRGHAETVDALGFSPDGRLLASGGRDQEVILWDAARGEKVRSWKADVADVESATFSPDGSLLLTSAIDRPPRLWDVETGRLLLEPGSLPADARGGAKYWSPAAFSPDGGRIVAGRESVVAILDGRPLPHPGGTATTAGTPPERGDRTGISPANGPRREPRREARREARPDGPP